jgi:hypothetical protein
LSASGKKVKADKKTKLSLSGNEFVEGTSKLFEGQSKEIFVSVAVGRARIFLFIDDRRVETEEFIET